MIDWRPYFPLPKPRPQQERALDELCSHVEGGKRVLLLEAGTGVGKSAIAVCLGRWLAARERVPPIGFAPGTVILTSNRSLQDQYMRDFPEACDLRSAQNFQCERGGTCGEMSRARKAVGPQHAGKLRCVACPYRAAKEAFKVAALGCTNYSFFLSEQVYAGELPLRHLLVLDEAHNLESETRRWSTVEVSEAAAEEQKLELPSGDDAQEAIQWLDKAYKAAIERRLARVSSKLLEQIEFAGVLGQVIHKLAEENDRLDKTKCQCNRLVQFGGEVLVSSSTNQKGKRSLSFQPLDVRGLGDDLFFKKSSACLMMSATILDKRVFVRHAGVPADAPFVQVPTPFKAKAFGVKFRPVGKMTQGEIDASLPKMVRAIRKILKAHPNEKGVIHCHSYKIVKAIELIKDDRLLIQRSAEDREGILQRHMASKGPTVLVSPAFTEGLDLKDELGRFSVICKAPYPYLGDPVVKRKDRDWYAWRTVLTYVQACGRGVRSVDDWTATYVLDASVLDLYDRSEALIPHHLKDDIALEEP